MNYCLCKPTYLFACFIICFCLQTYANTPPQIQLAHTYSSEVNVNEYWVSEKLDGIRARWDGRRLISRNGNLFYPPAWFIAYFPSEALDGELWIARGSFEQTASVVLKKMPHDGWRRVKFMLFDLPQFEGPFSERVKRMQKIVTIIDSAYLKVIPQFRVNSHGELMTKLDEVIAQGAEGLMLHHQNAYYQTSRNSKLLKLKKYQDAEATVVAHLGGKGKYENKLGALLVKLEDGIQFKIGSGFSDAQRADPPPIGSVINFKFYGRTKNGIPRFASFIRLKSTSLENN